MNNSKQCVEIPFGMIEVAIIQEKIAKIEAERDQFVTQANAQVERFNGAIIVLKELIAPPAEGPDTEGEKG